MEKKSFTLTQVRFYVTSLACLWMWEEDGEPIQIHIGRTCRLNTEGPQAWDQTRNLLAVRQHCYPLHHHDLQEICCGGEQSTNTISHICSNIFIPPVFFCCCSCCAAFAHGVLRRSAPISNLSFPGAVVHCYSYLSAGDFSTSPLHHMHYTRPCRPPAPLLSLRPHLPIMLCSSASLPLPLPYHLQ